MQRESKSPPHAYTALSLYGILQAHQSQGKHEDLLIMNLSETVLMEQIIVTFIFFIQSHFGHLQVNDILHIFINTMLKSTTTTIQRHSTKLQSALQ